MSQIDSPRLEVKGPEQLGTRHLFNLNVRLDPGVVVGNGPYGNRIYFPAISGRFEGSRLTGEMVSGGGDWALISNDGLMSLDVRIILRTTEGSVIYMTYGGRWHVPAELQQKVVHPTEGQLVDPESYYFRANPLFESGAQKYQWLNRVVGIAYGFRIRNGVGYKVFEVL